MNELIILAMTEAETGKLLGSFIFGPLIVFLIYYYMTNRNEND